MPKLDADTRKKIEVLLYDIYRAGRSDENADDSYGYSSDEDEVFKLIERSIERSLEPAGNGESRTPDGF